MLIAAALLALATPPLTATSVITPSPRPGPAVEQFVSHPAGTLLLRNLTLVDGTGGPVQRNRSLLIQGNRIAAIGGPNLKPPPGATILDLAGHAALPGLIGMHNHYFHISRPNLRDDGTSDLPLLVPQMSFSAPRLYLAAGVTTVRTAGSVEPYADLNLKARIDSGELPGPRMDVTGPYIEGEGSRFLQMHGLGGPAEARRMVDYWADLGVSSIKIYMNVAPPTLKAAVDAAHARGLKVTGHLCATTYAEAADLGIDNLEHGFFADTALDPNRTPGTCPPTAGTPTLAAMDPAGPEAAKLIRLLIDRKVALTSTLPIFEQGVAGRPLPSADALAALAPDARADFMRYHARREQLPDGRKAAGQRNWRNALGLERAFAAAGGLLMAGPDPTGSGGIVPGCGDIRGIQLLTEAGFAPVEAVRIATLNGAVYLGIADRLGSLEAGKLADILIVKGDPSADVTALEAVQLVFKDGVGYDPVSLRANAGDRFGRH